MPFLTFATSTPLRPPPSSSLSASFTLCPRTLPRENPCPSPRRSTRLQKLVPRAEVSLAAAILRALHSKFPDQDISRVVQSFDCVISGDTLEAGKGTPRHQRATSFIRGLSATPFPATDGATFAWVRHLERNWRTIADELQRATGQGNLQERGNNVWAPPVVEAANAYGPDWRTLVLQDREWDPTNTHLFPETTRVLRDSGEKVPCVEAFFARQAADTGIKLHTDDCNFILTMHLGLSVPHEKAWIEVAGERRYWENGKGLVFNTSFFHRTMNESKEQDRVVLLVRFWHPQLTAVEREALTFLFQLIDNPGSHPATLRAERELRAEAASALGQKGRQSRPGGRGFGS